MTPTAHYVCTTCERVHEAEPLRCGCGGAEFTLVNVETSAFRLRVAANSRELAGMARILTGVPNRYRFPKAPKR